MHNSSAKGTGRYDMATTTAAIGAALLSPRETSDTSAPDTTSNAPAMDGMPLKPHARMRHGLMHNSSAVVEHIAAARKALGAGDMATAKAAIGAALQMPAQ